MSVKQYVYGRTLIEVHAQGWVRVVLPDGKTFTATPEANETYRTWSTLLGYTDNGHSMNLEHDRFHAMLAQMLGLPESPALRASADGVAIDDLTGAEEAVVLALARYVNELRKRGMWPAL